MQFPWKKNISFNFCITDCLRTYYYDQFFYSLSRRLPYCSARNVSNTRDRIVKNDHAIIVGGHKNIEIQAGLFINSSPKSLSLLLMPLATIIVSLVHINWYVQYPIQSPSTTWFSLLSYIVLILSNIAVFYGCTVRCTVSGMLLLPAHRPNRSCRCRWLL